MFINDIDSDFIHSKILLCADDTVLYATHENEISAHLWMNEYLNVLCNWCHKNQLTINLKKTKLMLFGTRNMFKSAEKCDTFMDETKLQYVNHSN